MIQCKLVVINFYTGIFRRSTVAVRDQANKSLGKSSSISSVHKHEMKNRQALALWKSELKEPTVAVGT